MTRKTVLKIYPKHKVSNKDAITVKELAEVLNTYLKLNKGDNKVLTFNDLSIEGLEDETGVNYV